MATQVESKGWTRDQMAARAAKELRDGYYVNPMSLGAPYDTKIEFRTVREAAPA